MRKYGVQGLLVLGCLLGTSLAFAQTSSWSGSAVITRIVSYGDGVRAHSFRTSFNPAGCSQVSQIGPHPNLNAAAREEIGRLMTAAYLAGKQIQLKIDDTTCSAAGYRLYTAIEML